MWASLLTEQILPDRILFNRTGFLEDRGLQTKRDSLGKNIGRRLPGHRVPPKWPPAMLTKQQPRTGPFTSEMLGKQSM